MNRTHVFILNRRVIKQAKSLLCPCGLVVHKAQLKKHQVGSLHEELTKLKAENYPKCPSCELHYSGPEALHELNALHYNNAEALSLFRFETLNVHHFGHVQDIEKHSAEVGHEYVKENMRNYNRLLK